MLREVKAAYEAAVGANVEDAVEQPIKVALEWAVRKSVEELVRKGCGIAGNRGGGCWWAFEKAIVGSIEPLRGEPSLNRHLNRQFHILLR